MDPICPRCGEGEERITHLFGKCSESCKLWYASPLRLTCPSNIESFKQWCSALRDIYNEDQWWNLFWILAWQVWLARKKWLFEGKDTETSLLIDRAVNLAHDFAYYDKKEPCLSNESQSSKVWKRPPLGILKINADAARFEEGICGLGAVFRDHEGDVIASYCDVFNAKLEVDEALAIRGAVEIASDIGLNKIMVESDCLKLINHLQKRKVEASAFGQLVADILAFMKNLTSFYFLHLKREGNIVAHRLSHISIYLGEMRVWMEEVPVKVHNAVLSDSSMIEENQIQLSRQKIRE